MNSYSTTKEEVKIRVPTSLPPVTLNRDPSQYVYSMRITDDNESFVEIRQLASQLSNHLKSYLDRIEDLERRKYYSKKEHYHL